MTTTMIAALAGLVLANGGMAQDPAAPSAAMPGSANVPSAALLEGATAAPECGNLHGLAGRAFCVTSPLAQIGSVADAYIGHFEAQGWLAAGGDDNRVVMIKRQDGGGCEGLQILAFYDESRPAVAEAPGYIAMASIPGDVCAAITEPAPVAPSTPQ